jgi:hypothetical protein
VAISPASVVSNLCDSSLCVSGGLCARRKIQKCDEIIVLHDAVCGMEAPVACHYTRTVSL